MRQSNSQDDVRTLLREADVAARRLVRKLRLPFCDLDDVRQDLLTDALARLPSFDAERGTLGGFAGLVMANRAGRLARRVHRLRERFAATASLDHPASHTGDEPLGAFIAEEQGLAAVLGHWQDPVAAIERRLDFERLVDALDPESRRLALALADGSAHRLARTEPTPRSTLYRKVRVLRARLAMAAMAVRDAHRPTQFPAPLLSSPHARAAPRRA